MGAWVEIIHKCPTPDLRAIEQAEAQVGSIWQCESDDPKCEDRWKLRQIKADPGNRGNVNRVLPDWQRLTVNGDVASGGE